MQAIEVARIPAVRGGEVWRLAETEYRRLAGLLRQLAPKDWSRATDCERWDVRALALHVLGSTEANASLAELAHQFRRGLPLSREIDHHHWVDGVNELQVRERSELSPAEVMARLEAAIPKAVRGRRTVPPPLRWMPVPFGPPIGWKPLTYLLRMGFTRDTWMHRVDVARATGREPTLSADHDGRIVADIVAEWARRHARPFTLSLRGPAGGTYRQGTGGEGIDIDAVEFCRTLSGRRLGAGLLEHKLPL